MNSSTYTNTFLFITLCICLSCGTNTETIRSELLFDFDWKFYRGEIQDQSAATINFDDSNWRKIDLPHDWSIEDIPGTNSPLDPSAIGGVSSGYFVGGTGWYRKEFSIDKKFEGSRVIVQFEGIYMNSDVWINGNHLGNHPYGYTEFEYDLTDHILFGEKNLLAVEVKNEGRNSRWYSGSGIYRHVWVKILNPVRIKDNSVRIETFSDNSEETIVNLDAVISTSTVDQADIELRVEILDHQNRMVSQTSEKFRLVEKAETGLTLQLPISTPDLWSLENPYMYTARLELFKGPSQVDKLEIDFGVRSLDFSVENGFRLNGKSILLKGGCMHHDNGPLGARAYDRAEERKVEIMKANGYNAIRCAHNPPSRAFLDACDRIGMLVIDEAFDQWRIAKNPQDYNLYFDEWWQKDIESMVMRDINHPSIIMWSIGNEIPEQGDPKGEALAKKLVEKIRSIDKTRPVTAAINQLGPDKDPFLATLDISGLNYSVGGDHWKKSIYEIDHERVPDRIMYCSESYPLKAFGSWMSVLEYPYVIGDFVWTSLDYLGEASIGWLGYWQGDFYPWSHAFCGDIDICGYKRPQSYYRDVLWNQESDPLSIWVHPPDSTFENNTNHQEWSRWHWTPVVSSWNWQGHEGETFTIDVYSASEQVELFLDQKSLGIRESNVSNEFIASWQVPYKSGKLSAVAYKNGEVVTQTNLITAGKVNSLIISADRDEIKADGMDLSYITIQAIDEGGIRNPLSENYVEYEITGPAMILAVASSNPMSTESYQGNGRKLYQGRGLVIIKSTGESGKIWIKAQSKGLESAELVIHAVN